MQNELDGIFTVDGDFLSGAWEVCRDQNPEVVAHHAPADPALHAIEAAITTARQAITPFHNTDSALTSGAHSLAAAKPALMLLRAWSAEGFPTAGYTLF